MRLRNAASFFVRGAALDGAKHMHPMPHADRWMPPMARTWRENAAAGFAALGLIAAAVWWRDGVPRKTPETPRLRPWFGLKARGSARVGRPAGGRAQPQARAARRWPRCR